MITEETPLRGNKESYYSHTKLIVEGMLDEFETFNPDVIVTRLRPSIFCGPNINNFFLDAINFKVLFFPDSNSSGLPVVHEGDVGRAFWLAIKKDAPGAFNITADSLDMKTMSEVLKIPAIGLPFFFLKPMSDLLYSAGLMTFSSHWTVLGRYPFNASHEKAARVLGWRPEKSARDAFIEMVEAHKRKNGGKP